MRCVRSLDRAVGATVVAYLLPVLLFAGGVVICLHYSPLYRQFSFDNQIYFYIAERVASGEAPHVSLVDHKHQLSSLLSGWAMLGGRLAGLQDYVSARILSIAAAAACAPLLWGLGLRLGRSLWAANFAGLAMLGFVDFFYQGAMGVRPKVFMAFFLVAALNAAAKRRQALAGAAAAASFLCWQPAAIVPAGIGVACLCGPGKGKRLAAFACGVIAVMVAYESYFLWHGALHEQLYQSYRMAIDPGGYRPHTLTSTFWFIVHMGLWRHDAGQIYPLAAMVVLMVLWARALRQPRASLGLLEQRPELTAALIYGHGALVFTFVDRQAYPDMFFLYPFLALMLGLGLSAIVGGLRERGWLVAGAVFALLVSTLMVVLPYSRLPLFGPPRKSITVQQTAAKQLDIVREQYGSIWAVGCPHLLAFNHWKNSSPFGLLIDRRVHAYMHRISGAKPWRPLRDGRAPGAILLSRGGYGRQLMGWIRRNYREVANRSLARQHVHLWVSRWPRIDDAAGLSASAPSRQVRSAARQSE